MRTLMRLDTSAQRAYLPIGKPALSMLLTLAAIAAAPVAGSAQDAPARAVPAHVAPSRGVPPEHRVAPPALTPIQHVIVIWGENRSFDHVFGTYVPKGAGQTIWNLFSEGIVDANGQPGRNYDKSAQFSAMNNEFYAIDPPEKQLYINIPPIGTGGAPTAPSDTLPGGGAAGPFLTAATAMKYEPNLPTTGNYYTELTTGATGLPGGVADTRIPNVNNLRSGVVQLTSPTLTYDDYAASPVHRFYQMWQQTDCSAANATRSNPSGCQGDLFPWVEVTIGAGSNGSPQKNGFNDLSTGEGSTSMAFYNMQTGDVPYLKSLADQYTISDNFHQGVMGGTGPNHIMLNYADAMWYSDGNGNPATPAYNQVENPNPQPGTNNWYAEDGYSGGSYTDCSDINEPGVAPIVSYLQSLPTPIYPNCETGHYYLLNNYNPAYNGDGSSTFQYSPYTVPPTTQPHIGDILGAAGLSYTFFGEGWNLYLTDPAGQNPYDAYCNICNGFQYAKDIMTNPAEIAAHIGDMNVFFSDVASNTLPAVSIIQPSGFVDGHPASSKIDLWEGFVQNIITKVQASPAWQNTAIFMLFDEGGGYYDSGYIQPLDYFGDGTRMPLLIVSPWSEGGVVDHTYTDHASIAKFIERNWNLPTISYRSRDNFPNPTTAENPYVPTNSPAIGDLFSAFTFPTGSAFRPTMMSEVKEQK
jgi:phospholipase C